MGQTDKSQTAYPNGRLPGNSDWFWDVQITRSESSGCKRYWSRQAPPYLVLWMCMIWNYCSHLAIIRISHHRQKGRAKERKRTSTGYIMIVWCNWHPESCPLTELCRCWGQSEPLNQLSSSVWGIITSCFAFTNRSSLRGHFLIWKS